MIQMYLVSMFDVEFQVTMLLFHQRVRTDKNPKFTYKNVHAKNARNNYSPLKIPLKNWINLAA